MLSLLTKQLLPKFSADKIAKEFKVRAIVKVKTKMIRVMNETILKKTTTICRLLVLSNQEALNSELIEGVNFWTNKYARATIRSLQASRRLPPNSWLGVGLKMAWQLVTLKHFGPDNRYGPCDSGSLVHWWGAINPLFSADNGRRYIFYHQYFFHLCGNDSCIPRRQKGYNPV